MNELMIKLNGAGWLYFKTDNTTADKALSEFEKTCENARINIDNIDIAYAELRDSHDLVIDSYTKK